MPQKAARDVMVTNVVSIRPDQTLVDAIQLLLSYQISGLPVLDEEDNVIGCLTEHDIMNFAFSGEADVTKAKEAMTKPAFSFTPDTDLAAIVNAFAKNRIRRVVITDQQKLKGIVSRRDILREMLWMYAG